MPSRTSSTKNSTEQRRALVKWTDGAHAGTYTHNVSFEWIHNFDAASPIFPETYAIDWRVPPKPRDGWPVFEGLVLDISSDLPYLKSKADELKRNSTLDNHGADDDEDARIGSENSSNLMDINSQAFKDLVARLSKSYANHSSSRSSSHDSTSSSTPPKEKVSIGKSLCVDRTVYTLAANASSPGRMVRPLLRQAFSRRRLIASTYAGQKRVVNGNLCVKPSLKKYQKMADIHTFVLQKYPHLSQGSFGAIVNSFLGERPNTIQTVESVSVC